MSHSEQIGKKYPFCQLISILDLKKNDFCMLKGQACRVTQVRRALPGKHGCTKTYVDGQCIFSNQTQEQVFWLINYIKAPLIQMVQYEVADISEDNFVTAILGDGRLREDLKLPTYDHETCQKLKQCWQQRGEKTVFFTILRAVAKEKYILGRYEE